ncbi:hypothetical protein [Streptomyces sp. NPDC127112]|uniref:hypothetical protein n=1 Tax=Streptomyces sp. NPDC127112 TaxID=3345364 RepID=UPI00362A86BB
MYDKGMPSLEGIIKDLDARVRALENAPAPTIPKRLAIEELFVAKGVTFMSDGGAGWYGIHSDSNALYRYFVNESGGHTDKRRFQMATLTKPSPLLPVGPEEATDEPG